MHASSSIIIMRLSVHRDCQAVLVGDFQSKCGGRHPGKGGEKIMEMLTEVWTRVDLVSLK